MYISRLVDTNLSLAIGPSSIRRLFSFLFHRLHAMLFFFIDCRPVMNSLISGIPSLDYKRSVHYNTGDDFHILYATLCLNINIFSHFIKFHSTPLTTNNSFTHLPSLKLFPLFRPLLKISNVVLRRLLLRTYKQVQQYL